MSRRCLAVFHSEIAGTVRCSLSVHSAEDAHHSLGEGQTGDLTWVDASRFDLVAHLRTVMAWSARTFGPGERSAGVVAHIRKELVEIEADPRSLEEWIDVVFLALDGAWRSGHTAEQIAAALEGKRVKNELRKWPDWRTLDPGKPSEHITEAPEPGALPAEFIQGVDW